MRQEFRFVEALDGTKHPIVACAFRTETWQDFEVGCHVPSSLVADLLRLVFLRDRYDILSGCATGRFDGGGCPPVP